jgi:hypothetical protein
LPERGKCRGEGSPPKHPSADIADRNGDAQRSNRLILNEEADRLRRPVASLSRLLAQAPDVLFNLAGGVLNCVRRATFHVLDQARDIALQREKILAT